MEGVGEQMYHFLPLLDLAFVTGIGDHFLLFVGMFASENELRGAKGKFHQQTRKNIPPGCIPALNHKWVNVVGSRDRRIHSLTDKWKGVCSPQVTS